MTASLIPTGTLLFEKGAGPTTRKHLPALDELVSIHPRTMAPISSRSVPPQREGVLKQKQCELQHVDFTVKRIATGRADSVPLVPPLQT
ncbi:hypothetical protein, partial [Methylobacterium sp. WL64]|uniref:hypothetical protein n=1 Tax=Methylobacterium sp. WL64 TaxID=2603894 RepID=UPI001AEEA4EE